MSREPIAIIGIAGRFPEAPDLETFFENLSSGRDSVRSVSRERIEATGINPERKYQLFGYLDGIDQFDHRFFGISKREADFMDPQHRMIVELAIECVENAGLSVSSMRGRRCSVILAGALPEYHKLFGEFDPTVVTGNHPSMIAGRVSHFFDLRGSSHMVECGCSASLVAINRACLELSSGEVDMAIAGGVNVTIFLPEEKSEGEFLGITSPDGKAKTFDAAANGTIGGEGGAIVLLKKLSKAIADGDPIHAIIRGAAENQNGSRSAGITAPSPVAQKELLLMPIKG